MYSRRFSELATRSRSRLRPQGLTLTLQEKIDSARQKRSFVFPFGYTGVPR